MPFDPDDIAGLALRAEAHLLTGLDDGDPVATFGDLFQATSVNQPAYDAIGGPNAHPAVSFDGASRFMRFVYPSPIAQPNTVYVAAMSNGLGVGVVFDGYSGAGPQQAYLNGSALALYAGSAYSAGWAPQILPLRWSLFEVVFDGAASRVYRLGIDGGAMAATPGASAMDGMTLGAYVTGGGNYLNGKVAGVLAYHGRHSDEQRQAVRGYAMAAWGFDEVAPQVVCVGDSLTEGYLLATPETESYPAQLAALMPTWDVTNDGISGQRADQLASSFRSRSGALYRPLRSRNVAVIEAGTNDLLLQGATAATVLSRLATFYATAVADGYSVVMTTMTPSTYPGQPGSGTFEAERLAVNAALRAADPGTYFDSLADLGADPVIGDVTNTDDPAYFFDGVHLTAAGYAIWAPYVQAAVLDIPGPPPTPSAGTGAALLMVG